MSNKNKRFTVNIEILAFFQIIFNNSIYSYLAISFLYSDILSYIVHLRVSEVVLGWY